MQNCEWWERINNVGTVFDYHFSDVPTNQAGGMYNDRMMEHVRPEHDPRRKAFTYSVYNPY
jgi:hypothetical protein